MIPGAQELSGERHDEHTENGNRYRSLERNRGGAGTGLPGSRLSRGRELPNHQQDGPLPESTALALVDGDVGDPQGDEPSGAERQLAELGIVLPPLPRPFGTYVEAVQTGNLLFLTGMLPTENGEAKFIGRVGAVFDVEAGLKAARLAALNALAVAREHLGLSTE